MRSTFLVALILLALPLTGYFYSCNPCKDTKAIHYCTSVDSISFTPLDNKDSVLQENATVKWSRVHWQLGITYTNTSCRNNEMFSPSAFVNYAYACSPAEYVTQTDSIVSIELYCDRAFDESHPAGASLNDIFAMPDVIEMNTGNDLIYSLKKAPAENGIYRFSINVTLSDLSIRKVYCLPLFITQ